MNRSESIAALAVALAKAQAAIKPAAKDAENPHFRSRYADLPSVWEACRKPLTDNGLSVVQMPVDAENGRVGLTTILLHSSGEFISSTVSTALTKQDAQGIGSALTYLRRYALSAIVGVVADEDDDGNAASRPAQNGAANYQSQPQQQNGSAQQQRPQGENAPSEAQIKMLRAKMRDWEMTEPQLFDWGRNIIKAANFANLTKREASALIDAMVQAEKANADAPAT